MKRSFNHLCSFLEKSNLYFPAQDCFSFVCNLTLDERQWKIWVDSKERWLLDEENVLLSLDSRNENDSNQGVVLKTQDIDRETRICSQRHDSWSVTTEAGKGGQRRWHDEIKKTIPEEEHFMEAFTRSFKMKETHHIWFVMKKREKRDETKK